MSFTELITDNEIKDSVTKNLAFEIRAEDVSDDGVFTGYGSTFTKQPDSYGDVIAQGAFSETVADAGYGGLGIKMLWQHDWNFPIGRWLSFQENGTGLKVTGQFALDTQKGKEAYSLLKMGAINALSIGFRVRQSREPDDRERKKGIERVIEDVELFEISLVTFPANTRAKITNVKSAIENAQTERELERGLRQYMSKEAAKYITSLCKPTLFGKKSERSTLLSIAESIQQVRKQNQKEREALSSNNKEEKEESGGNHAE